MEAMFGFEYGDIVEDVYGNKNLEVVGFFRYEESLYIFDRNTHELYTMKVNKIVPKKPKIVGNPFKVDDCVSVRKKTVDHEPRMTVVDVEGDFVLCAYQDGAVSNRYCYHYKFLKLEY